MFLKKFTCVTGNYHNDLTGSILVSPADITSPDLLWFSRSGEVMVEVLVMLSFIMLIFSLLNINSGISVKMAFLLLLSRLLSATRAAYRK